ncbi:MAG: alpha/beta hydrolase [Oligoflexales bacterium]|nr:alpha/beta hydrolase [Oligoflexales bacterium]
MPKLKVKDGIIYYEILGSGSPLFLQHGLARSSRYWLGFDKELSKYFQVIIFDTRGLGKSQKSKVPLQLSIQDLAEDICQLAQKLNIESFHLLGTSMGGMVCLALALMKPELLKSIIIMNSSIAGHLTPRLSLIALASIGISAILPKLTPPISALTLLGKSTAFKKRLELYRKWQTHLEEEALEKTTVLKQLLAAARFGLGLPLEKIKTPALILYGENDFFVPNKNSLKIFKKIPHALIKKIPGVGHEMFAEKPEELALEVYEFTQSIEK